MKTINIEPLLATPLIATLATGTIVEKIRTADYAREHVYGTWWFYALMALVGVYAIALAIKELKSNTFQLSASLPRILLCLSAATILAGGALTAATGSHGSVTIMPGATATTYQTDRGDSRPFPFAITLDRFETVPYPGTHTPMDFVSHIHVDGQEERISMNSIYRRSGYRLYQEDYGDDGSTTLSVAHDPWGIGTTYAGYLLAVIGIVGLFVLPESRFRRTLRKSAAAAAVIAFLATASAAAAAPRTLPKATADKMGMMYVLYKGRVCPLQTLAKEFSTKLTGSAHYKGLTPEQLLSGWIFYFNDWADEEIIKIKGEDVKQVLGTQSRRTSFADMLRHRDAFERRRHTQEPLPTPGNIQSTTMRAASEKYNLVQMLLSGTYLKMFPVADSLGETDWYAQNDDLPFETPDDDYFFIRKQLSYCQELVVEGDFAALEDVFDKTIVFQRKRATVLQSDRQYNAERLYNKLDAGKWPPVTALAVGLLAFLLALHTKNADWRRRADNASAILVATLTLFLITTFILRWIAGGHIPMSGGFDSMNLMATVVGVTGLAIRRRHRIASSTALLAMGFCTLVATMSGSNPPVTNLMPVLNSPLLTLHVTVIMISYALFFCVAMNGVAALFRGSQADEMRRTSTLMLYPAISLLAIGIIIGAVWANISWGTYWSWDPKEVWALITLIVYLYPTLREFRTARAFHIYHATAFISVIITYFGVNLILGGIHAYN